MDDIRQVPEKKMNTTHPQGSKILIIGAGRLVKHLTHWCSLLSIPTITWQRPESLETLNKHLNTVKYIWLAISDNSLESFYTEHIKNNVNPDQTVVHFSGSFHHTEMISAHPLMTFSSKLYDLDDYQKIYFALTGADDLQTALPGFKNAFFKLAPEQKELYHALCVVMGNLPQILWSQSQPLLQQLHIPESAISIYLQKSLSNYLELQSDAITGPLIRNDQSTIFKNLTALEKNHPKLSHIYRSFLKEHL